MKNIEFTKKPKEGQPWDVAIVGSGPAALTAGIYTTRGAASTLILGGENWGGQLMLTTEVDNYPGFPEGVLGGDLMQKFRQQVERFSAEFVEKSVSSVDFTANGAVLKLTAGDTEYLAKSVILATGADTQWLGVEGEERLRGRGVSSCAPCDAPFFKEKKVAVVGGGDSAMEEAMVLTKYAKSVTLIHRRDEFKASQAMQQRVFESEKAGRINILWNTEVTSMVGEDRLTSVRLKTGKDTEQAKKLKKDHKLEEVGSSYAWELEMDGLFVAIGHVPSTGVFKGQVELDEKGYIKKYERDGFRMLTSTKGVFVAGDVHDVHYRQAVTAAGFGCMAGMEVLRYLDKPVPTW
jgi:thioredoxin reductase (NADPH)